MSLVAPDYVTPRSRRHRPPVVSLKPVGEPVSRGIKLWVNSDKYGYQLADGAEGFGMADVDNTVTATAGGGAVLRHQRSVEGEMYLPIQLTAPSSAALDDMAALLADIVNPAGGEFEVVYYSPVSQEARFRRVAYKSGMLTPAVWLPHVGYAEYGVTGDFVEPLWRGEEREIPFEIAPQRKPLITAYQGEPDPSNPSYTFEWDGDRHASPSVMFDGDGNIVARNLIANPSFENGVDNLSSGSGISEISHSGTSDRAFAGSYSAAVYVEDSSAGGGWIGQNLEGTLTPGEWLAFSASVRRSSGPTTFRYWVSWDGAGGTFFSDEYHTMHNGPMTDLPRVAEAVQIPSGVTGGRIWLRVYSGTSAPDDGLCNTDAWIASTGATEAEALAQVETYFDGDTRPVVGRYEGYEFPFLPMMVHSSVVDGEQEIMVEGDAPTYPVITVTGPGEDLRLFGPKGEELYIPGQIDGRVTIVNEPRYQTIRDQDGNSLMSRLEFGRDKFFALEPGTQTIGATMVGAGRDSLVRIAHEERFRLPAGNIRRR